MVNTGLSHLTSARGQQDTKEVVVVPAGHKAFCGKALFAWFTFEQGNRQPSQGGHVLGTMSFAGAALVFAEGEVQDPMQRVFDTPVRAYRMSQLLRVGFQAADEVASEGLFSPTDDAPALDHAHALQVPPQFPVAERFRNRSRIGRPMLFAPVRFLVRFVAAALGVGKNFRLLLREVCGDIFVQRVLVLLEGENVVRLLLADLADDRPLTAGRVDGHDRAAQALTKCSGDSPSA